MTVAVSGDSITFPDNSVQATAPTGFGFKNRIFNGNMAIDQRNVGASVNAVTGGQYSLDRWNTSVTVSNRFSIQQNAGAVATPAGFPNYLGVTSLLSTVLASSDFYAMRYQFEGFSTADLNWGTASASPVTLSFLVRSSLTGTFGGSVKNNANNRSYPFSYTINAANTWETKTVTIPGDTTGTWPGAVNTRSLQLSFGLGVGTTRSGPAGAWASTDYSSVTGAVSVVGTSGATFYITGVQLEKGSTATSFDYRPYGTELALCQRYYWKNKPSSLYSWVANGRQESTFVSFLINYPSLMRAAPTFSFSNMVLAVGTIGSILATYAGDTSSLLQINSTGGTTTGYVNALQQNSAGVGYLDASAEL